MVLSDWSSIFSSQDLSDLVVLLIRCTPIGGIGWEAR